MILSPIGPDSLDEILNRFRAALGDDALASQAFERIAVSRSYVSPSPNPLPPGERALDSSSPRGRRLGGGGEPSGTVNLAAWHERAVELAAAFGMNPLAQEPQQFLSWDGRHVRVLTEPSVLLHEVAHFQIASPERRWLPDFGMGAGPESGMAAVADAARRVYGDAFEIEEQMTSLLGILWEAELGQPAILAFQEQNWLEGAGRASTAEFFKKTLRLLRHAQLIGDDAEPLMTLNRRADSERVMALPRSAA